MTWEEALKVLDRVVVSGGLSTTVLRTSEYCKACP